MKKSIYYTAVLLLVLSACGSETQEQDEVKETVKNPVLESPELEKSKQNITNLLDSAEISFSMILNQLKKSPENLDEIKINLKRVTKTFERKVEAELNTLNQLGAENKITQKDADFWIKNIQTSETIVIYNNIKSKIDSLQSL